jgi:hypothetical protein
MVLSDFAVRAMKQISDTPPRTALRVGILLLTSNLAIF